MIEKICETILTSIAILVSTYCIPYIATKAIMRAIKEAGGIKIKSESNIFLKGGNE